MSCPERFTLTLQEGVATVHLAEAICALNDGILEPYNYKAARSETLAWKTESAWTWYAAEDELQALSKRFPDVTLCLFREPQDEGYPSYTYFRDGHVLHCPAVITYAPFNPAAVRPAAAQASPAEVEPAPLDDDRLAIGPFRLIASNLYPEVASLWLDEESTGLTEADAQRVFGWWMRQVVARRAGAAEAVPIQAEVPVQTAPAWNGRVYRGPTHTFTLVLDTSPETIVGPFADALFEAGCDDASLGASEGKVRLDFDREAPTLIEAVCSAIEEVASVGGRVLRVEVPTQSEEVPRG